MGCCQSRQQHRNKPQDERPSVVHTEALSTTPLPTPGGLKVHASRAGWVADSNFGDFVKISQISDRSLFACLFDPHSTQDAAAFCIERCPSVFEAALKKCNAEPETALEMTIETLDQQFLKSNLSAPVRALSGCSAVLAYIDWEMQKCWIANTGTSECVIGTSEGAFNSQFMEGKVMTHRHDSNNPEEQNELRERFPAESETLLQNFEGRTLLKGITKLTRCIGYGFAKDPKLAAVYNKTKTSPLLPLPNSENPYLLNKPYVEMSDLKRGAEKIILYSEGMGELLSPTEMAVFTMHFQESHLSHLADTQLKNEVSNGVAPSQIYPAVALIHHAVSRAADNFATVMNAFRQSMSTKPAKKGLKFDLVNLNDMTQFKVKQMPSMKQETIPKSNPFNRKDIHGNLSCVVISVESDDRTRSPSNLSSSPKSVVNRWKLIQLYCKFHIQRRRACLRRWWQLIALAVKDSQQRMLDQEKADWFQGVDSVAHIDAFPDAGLKIFTSEQARVSPTRFSSGFRKWLGTSARKGMGASLNEADFAAKVVCL